MYYKPLLGNRLEFPADWVGVSVTIHENGCSFEAFTDSFIFGCAGKLRLMLGVNVYLFAHFHEMLNALEKEPENRQFHVMADLISWHCKGPGAALPPQLGLDFGSDDLENFS